VVVFGQNSLQLFQNKTLADSIWDTTVFADFLKRALTFLELTMSISTGHYWVDLVWVMITETWGGSSMFPIPFTLSFNMEKSGRVVWIGWRNEKFVIGVSTKVFLNYSNCYFFVSLILLFDDPRWFMISWAFPLVSSECLFLGLIGGGEDFPQKGQKQFLEWIW